MQSHSVTYSIRARTACSSMEVSNGAARLTISAVAIAPSHHRRFRVRNVNIHTRMPQPDRAPAVGRLRVADGVDQVCFNRALKPRRRTATSLMPNGFKLSAVSPPNSALDSWRMSLRPNDKACRYKSQQFQPDAATACAKFWPKPLGLPMTNHTLFINACPCSRTYCLVSDRRSAALNWEGVVPSHVRKAR
jgi:hypothetical protein